MKCWKFHCWVGLLLLASTANAQSPANVYDGFTEPSYDILVAATEIGRLDELMVKVGDRVEAGATVARMEDSLQVLAIKIAKMQLGMHGELDAAIAERDLQLSRIENLRKLRSEEMTRPDELPRAETELRIVEAKLLTVQEQIHMRELELERFELQLDRRLVRVPMSGIIGEVLHCQGEYLTPGDAAVVRLIVTDWIYAVFNVPVEDIDRVHVGDSVAVFLRSNAETVSAKIESIAPEIDGESGTIRVRVGLDNREGKFRIGDRSTMRLIHPSGHESSAGLPLRGRLDR